MKYDVLVYNAKIYSLENSEDVFHNMLVKNGKIAMLIRDNYIPDNIDIQKDIRYLIDGRGRVITPSFIVKDIDLPLLMCALSQKNKVKSVKNWKQINDIILRLKKEEYRRIIDKCVNTFISNGITTGQLNQKRQNDQLHNKIIKDYNKKYKGCIVTPDSNLGDISQSQITEQDFDNLYTEFLIKIDPISAIAKELNQNYLSSKISVFTLFRKYTYHAGRDLGHKYRKGLLKEGYDADFIKLDKDPFTSNKGSIGEINIISTYVSSAKLLMVGENKKNLLNNLFKLY